MQFCKRFTVKLDRHHFSVLLMDHQTSVGCKNFITHHTFFGDAFVIFSLNTLNAFLAIRKYKSFFIARRPDRKRRFSQHLIVLKERGHRIVYLAHPVKHHNFKIGIIPQTAHNPHRHAAHNTVNAYRNGFAVIDHLNAQRLGRLGNGASWNFKTHLLRFCRFLTIKHSKRRN